MSTHEEDPLEQPTSGAPSKEASEGTTLNNRPDESVEADYSLQKAEHAAPKILREGLLPSRPNPDMGKAASYKRDILIRTLVFGAFGIMVGLIAALTTSNLHEFRLFFIVAILFLALILLFGKPKITKSSKPFQIENKNLYKDD